MAEVDPVERLEAKVLDLAGKGYLDRLDRIEALLASAPDKVKAEVLKLVLPTLGADVVGALGDAFGMGMTSAVADISDDQGALSDEDEAKVKKVRKRTLPKHYPDSLAETRRRLQALRVQTLLALKAGEDPRAVVPALLTSRGVLSAGITTLVNEAHADGVTLVARATDNEMVLEPERDACVRCLAYAGKRTKDGTLPARLTFGKTYPSMPAVQRCPIHPRCRCRLRVVPRTAAADVSDALEREAKRSILRGYALPTESVGIRLQATKDLLAKGSGMPKSVEAFARRAVKAKAFPNQGQPEGTRIAGR